MEHQLETRNFQHPDDQLNFHSHGQIEIIKMKDGTTGMYAELKPGWKWSVDEKPLLGNPASCPMLHKGYCLEGELVIRMVESNEVKRIRKGEFFVIPAGHDANVPGNETCKLILFQEPTIDQTH